VTGKEVAAVFESIRLFISLLILALSASPAQTVSTPAPKPAERTLVRFHEPALLQQASALRQPAPQERCSKLILIRSVTGTRPRTAAGST
jgi:hypothetical protein